MTVTVTPVAAQSIKAAQVAEMFRDLVSQLDRVVSGYGIVTTTNSLTATVQPGKAYVGGKKVGLDTDVSNSTITLVANQTNHVYVKNDGTFPVNQTGILPSGCIKLYAIVASGTGVATPGTDITDSRDNFALRVSTDVYATTFRASSYMVTPTIGASSSQQHTLPAVSSSTLAVLGAAQTWTGVQTLNSPVLVTPTLGVATATSINKVAFTTPATSATLTIANGKTLTANANVTIAANSITLEGVEVLTLAAAKNVTFADAFATSGAFSITLTATAATTVTLPVTGTLATLAGTEALTGKTYNGLTVTTTTATLTLVNGSSFVTTGAFSVTLTSTATTVATLPAGTDTLMGLGTAQTVTAAKTFNTSTLLFSNGQVLTTVVTAQTVGAANLTLPNFAGVSDVFVFTTLAQTLAGKTLTSPTISSGALSGTFSGTPQFSGSIGIGSGPASNEKFSILATQSIAGSASDSNTAIRLQAATVTFTGGTAQTGNLYSIYLRQQTYTAATTPGTSATAATLFIEGAPIGNNGGGATQTITTSYAIFSTGIMQFEGARLGITNVTGKTFNAASSSVLQLHSSGDTQINLVANAGTNKSILSFMVGSDPSTASANGSIFYDHNAAQMVFQAGGGTTRFYITSAGNLALGTASLATNATVGFPYIPTMSGSPSGTPTAITGMAAMVWDDTNKTFNVYSPGASAWQQATGSGNQWSLTPAGAVLPTTAGPTLTKTTGSNFTYYTLDHNDSATNTSQWFFHALKATDITITIYWFAAATTGNVKWQVQVRGATSGVWDGPLTTAVTTTTAVSGTTLNMVTSTLTITAPFAATDPCVLTVARLGADGADTMTGDAKIAEVKVKWA